MSTSARTLSRQLTLRYLFALSVVAALSVGAYVAMGTVIRTESRRAGEINLSGRQRMLSQRIALHSQLLGEKLSAPRRLQVREELAEAIGLMRRSHEGLVRGAADSGSDELKAVYFRGPAEADRRTRRFLRDGDAVLERSGIVRSGDPGRLAVLAAARKPLPEALDRAVTAFQQESAYDVGRLDRVSLGVLLATLTVLLLEALVVFRPLAGHVRRRTHSLAVAEGRLRAVVENALVGVMTLDPQGLIISANATAATIFGRTPSELSGLEAATLVQPGAQDKLATLVDEALADLPLEACELGALRADGSSFTAEVAVSAARTPDDVTLVMLVSDVTERKTFEAQLSHRALHDTLTGLPNRLLLLDRLAQAQARIARDGGRLALLFIDLDRFKAVNDSLGHDAGDHLLKTVARRLEQLLRGTDTLARFGGDEFLVLCDGAVTENEALKVAERILAALNVPIELPGDETAFVGASIGIALSGAGDGESGETIIQNADTAMYRAKRRGGGDYGLFDPATPRRTHLRMHQEVALRRAIAEGELELHYQPVVCLESRRVRGFEALVRWRHPELGLIAPAEFIPLAEETGLVIPLGDWVIGEACRQAVLWQGVAAAGLPLTMAVNVAPAQLESRGLIETVRRALAEVALDAVSIRLGLEITERTLARDPERVRSTLDELRALGVSVSLDDFGTGYSTLAHLKHFAFDALKVDQTFVSGLGGDQNDGLIVEAVIGLGRALGLAVVAEGVETEAELARLLELGCPLGQGFLFARPLPASEVGLGFVAPVPSAPELRA